jgi:formate-dependent nitrite reductase membrane component NrfD
MFEYTDYTVAPWGTDLAVYFFLIGTAAMVFVLAAAPQVFGGAARALAPLQLPATIIALLIAVVCGPLLIMDLGQPGRFFYPILYFRWTSPLSWGSVLLVLFGLSMLAFAYGLYRDDAPWLRTVGIIGSLLALSMPLYTGIDLMANQAREVWQSPLIPVLFVVLSITSGAAVFAVLARVWKAATPEATVFLRRVLLASVAVTLVLFFIEVVALTFGSQEEQTAWTLINSEFSMRFWLLTLLIGIVVPLVLLVLPALARNPILVPVAGIAGAIGAYTFREVILYAGQLPQLYY